MTTDRPDDPAALPAVAPQLRELRRRAGHTLETAARAAGLSAAHLSRLETGQRQPSLPMLLALARVYGTTVSALLGETGGEQHAVIRGAEAEPAPMRRLDVLALRRVRARHAGAAGTCALRRAGRHGAGPPRRGVAARAARAAAAAPGESEHLLHPGDGAHFDSLTPHRIGAADADGAELLFVHTLLQSPGAPCLGPGHPNPKGPA